MQFEIEKPESSIIKVFGVGGGGSNAVNHMFKQGIKGVDFYICNTDEQSLEMSPVPNKIQLGLSLTGGRGAGSIAEVGKNADKGKPIVETDPSHEISKIYLNFAEKIKSIFFTKI